MVKVTVKCNQTGKIFRTPLETITNENGEELDIDNIFHGQSVIFCDKDDKSYDVIIWKKKSKVEIKNCYYYFC